jgi:hypothetical protein
VYIRLFRRVGRHRRRRNKYSLSSAPPGWYKNKTTRGYIGHYVRAEYRASGQPRPERSRQHSKMRLAWEEALLSGKLGTARARRRAARRLRFERYSRRSRKETRAPELAGWSYRGAGTLKSDKLVSLPLKEIPPLRSRLQPSRLNLSFYSQGIESLTLEQWQAGKANEALELLLTGSSYVRAGGFKNLRLYDLWAGLLVRSGHIADLRERISELRDATDQLRRQSSVQQTAKMDRETEIQLQRLESRIKRWSDPGWAQKWQPSQLRKWNGLEL